MRSWKTTRDKKSFSMSHRDSLTTTGFTLIEVVVALAILSIGLTVIIESFAGGLRLAKTSQDYTKAMNFAKMKIEEITSQQKVEEGTDEGKCDDERFRWQVKIDKKTDMLPVEKDVDFTAPVELFQIKVDVFWKSGDKERSAGLETYQAIKLETDQGKT